MSIFKFRVSWTEDDNIQRDIEILSSQNFMILHDTIKKAFALKAEWEATFEVINAQGKRERSVSSTVEKNLRDAPALSCKRTPIGALVAHPHQEFIYAVLNDAEWDFRVELVTIDKDVTSEYMYPRVVRTEGINPLELSSKGIQVNDTAKSEDKYDLDSKDGFEDEGDDDTDSSSDDADDSSSDDGMYNEQDVY
jgi:hypothetical protein